MKNRREENGRDLRERFYEEEAGKRRSEQGETERMKKGQPAAG